MFRIVPPKEITCPACLGKHRAHTFDTYCKLGPGPDRVPEDVEDPFHVIDNFGAL